MRFSSFELLWKNLTQFLDLVSHVSLVPSLLGCLLTIPRRPMLANGYLRSLIESFWVILGPSKQPSIWTRWCPFWKYPVILGFPTFSNLYQNLSNSFLYSTPPTVLTPDIMDPQDTDSSTSSPEASMALKWLRIEFYLRPYRAYSEKALPCIFKTSLLCRFIRFCLKAVSSRQNIYPVFITVVPQQYWLLVQWPWSCLAMVEKIQ